MEGKRGRSYIKDILECVVISDIILVFLTLPIYLYVIVNNHVFQSPIEYIKLYLLIIALFTGVGVLECGRKYE